jgi:hypothetical protein
LFAVCLGSLPISAQEQPLEDLDLLLEPSPAQQAEPTPAQPPGGAVPAKGDDLEGLGGLEGLEGGAAPSPAPGEAAPARPAPAAAAGLRLSFNGYVKPVAVWEHREFPASFGGIEKDRFTTVGARTQLRATGVIKDRAQFFTAVNFDFNEVNQRTDTASSTSEIGALRMVESYVDLFGTSTRWRVGSQIVTWSFMDGFEVPTDRLNARDLGYKSNELEDNKLASTGAEFSWSFGDQRMDLFYIPVPKVNRLAPDFENVLNQDQTKGLEVRSGDSQYALALSGQFKPIDYQLTYVDGRNPRADLGGGEEGTCGIGTCFKSYQRVQSPGLDLQVNLGSVLGRLSAVYWNTQDIGNDDALIQNDWWQAMVGIEFWLDSALVQLNAGQKQVLDHQKEPEFNNILLGQTNKAVDIVAGIVTDQFLAGDALELTFLFAYLWDDETGELVALRIRPSFTYNLADGVALTFIPGFSNEIGIETTEFYVETKFSF